MTVERYPSDFANFSDAVAVSGAGTWINVSGQVGFDENMKLVEGGVAAETHATFDCIERVLAKAGADLSHVIRITVFMTDLSDYGEFSRVRSERFGDKVPASAAVGVADLLVGASIEIDAVAFVPED
jgi:reactive intermediate/imine deaminase